MATNPKARKSSESAERYERISIDALRSDPSNVRRHPQRNIDAIKSSLSRFGQQRPLVVNQDGLVIAGNGTLQAAIELGWTHIDVVRSSLSGVEATAFAVADNRTAELAEWDKEALAEQLQMLHDIDEALAQDAGFTAREIEEMLGGHDASERADVAMPAIQFRIIVLCKDEHEQAELFERLRKDGHECQLLMS